MVVIPVHIPVRVSNFKSDLLYVFKLTVDAWYPLPPYQCCTCHLTCICTYNELRRSEGEEMMLYLGIMVLTLTSPSTQLVYMYCV